MYIENLKKSVFIKDVLITLVGQFVVMAVAFGLNKLLSNRYSVEMFGVYNIIKRSASVVFGDSSYKSYIVPIVMYAVGTALTTFVFSYYRGIGRFLTYSSSQIIVQLLSFAIGLISGANLKILYILWSIFYITYSIFVVQKAGRGLWPEAKINQISCLKEPAKELLTYGIPRVTGEFILFAYNLMPLTIISHKLGLTESGYFSAAISINTLFSSLFGFLGIVLLPLVSQSVVNKKFDGVKKKINALAIIYFVISVAIILIIELFPRFFIRLLFSQEYESIIPVLRITCLSILPNSLYLLYRNPIDGLCKFPFNTVSLTISFVITGCMMMVSKSMTASAYAFFSGYCILGFLSFLIWLINARKMLKN